MSEATKTTDRVNQLVVDLMQITLEKMIKDPESSDAYMDAFTLSLQNDFTGITPHFIKTFQSYLLLRKHILTSTEENQVDPNGDLDNKKEGIVLV